MASFLSTTNFSMWTIPAYWIISMIPRAHGKSLYSKATSTSTPKSNPSEGFDNRAPRSFTKIVENDKSLDQATKARILRAEAAFDNGFENFGPFCAAIVAANAARLDTSLVNGLSLAYLATRVAYNHFYDIGETQTLAGMRSMMYVSGLGMLFYLFVKAGSELSK